VLDFESGGEELGGFEQGGHGRSPQLKVVFLLYKVDRLLTSLAKHCLWQIAPSPQPIQPFLTN
jgi:hypothetical protein